MAYSVKGAWAIAQHWEMTSALKNKTLERFGFTLPWETGDDIGCPPTQPPDAENRTSGGVEGSRGAIPVSPFDL